MKSTVALENKQMSQRWVENRQRFKYSKVSRSYQHRVKLNCLDFWEHYRSVINVREVGIKDKRKQDNGL